MEEYSNEEYMHFLSNLTPVQRSRLSLGKFRLHGDVPSDAACPKHRLAFRITSNEVIAGCTYCAICNNLAADIELVDEQRHAFILSYRRLPTLVYEEYSDDCDTTNHSDTTDNSDSCYITTDSCYNTTDNIGFSDDIENAAMRVVYSRMSRSDTQSRASTWSRSVDHRDTRIPRIA